MLFGHVIALSIAGALLTTWSGELGIPYPVALAIAGAAAAFTPRHPDETLDPQIALALFVAPVLVDAAALPTSCIAVAARRGRLLDLRHDNTIGGERSAVRADPSSHAPRNASARASPTRSCAPPAPFPPRR